MWREEGELGSDMPGSLPGSALPGTCLLLGKRPGLLICEGGGGGGDIRNKVYEVPSTVSGTR